MIPPTIYVFAANYIVLTLKTPHNVFYKLFVTQTLRLIIKTIILALVME